MPEINRSHADAVNNELVRFSIYNRKSYEYFNYIYIFVYICIYIYIHIHRHTYISLLTQNTFQVTLACSRKLAQGMCL